MAKLCEIAHAKAKNRQNLGLYFISNSVREMIRALGWFILSLSTAFRDSFEIMKKDSKKTPTIASKNIVLVVFESTAMTYTGYVFFLYFFDDLHLGLIEIVSAVILCFLLYFSGLVKNYSTPHPIPKYAQLYMFFSYIFFPLSLVFSILESRFMNKAAFTILIFIVGYSIFSRYFLEKSQNT